MRSLRERLEAKIMPEPNSGCWFWLGALDGDGYGQIGDEGKNIKAYHAAYQLYVGEIPVGLEIDHLCRVRCCVNPDHLEAVTHAENIRRGNTGRHAREKTHCPQGHLYAGDNLYLRPMTGFRECRKCRRMQLRRWRARERNEP